MHPHITLACLVLASFGMGLLTLNLEMPGPTRWLAYTTIYVAAITCGIIIGRLMEAQ